MGDLSEHFDRAELACRHCGALVIADSLVEALEELRRDIGVPIIIASGYRCQAHNAAIGGARDSRHMCGDAADIIVHQLPMSRLFLRAAGVPRFHNGGIGIYPGRAFMHVDTRPGRARWGQINGVYVAFVTAWDLLQRQEGTA